LIIDTTYLLPLARIEIDTDLLKAVAEKKISLSLSQISVSLISLFELQAKAASESVPSKYVNEGIEAVVKAFKVEPFHSERVVEISFNLMKTIRDYIDCVVTATAASLKEDLVTEDSKILDRRVMLEERYGIRVRRLADMLRAR
jgi:PIN domain nuclease of toxin-antitoxin system